MNYDIVADSITAFQVTPADARTSTVTGSAVDVRNYIGQLGFIQDVGTVGGTNPTLNGKIQDSADGSTGWADVDGAAFAQVTATGNIQKITVNTRDVKRYVRYVGTIAGSTPSFDMGVIGVGKLQAGA